MPNNELSDRVELVQNLPDDSLVLDRQAVSEFGIAEWKLIERLENAGGGPISVSSGSEYSAAMSLFEYDIVEQTDSADEKEFQLRHEGPVVSLLI